MDQYAIVLFDPTSPFVDQIRLDERRIEIGAIQLSLKQQYEEDGKGGTEIGFGASVYPSSISLSEFLISCPDLVEGKRIVEIGCGPGLISLALLASSISGVEVVATDGDDGSVALAGENGERNGIEMRTERMRWGDEAEMTKVKDQLGGVDLLVGSDIVACPYSASFGHLVETILFFGCELILAYQERVGQEEEEFFHQVKDRDMDITTLHTDTSKHTILPIKILRITPPS